MSFIFIPINYTNLSENIPEGEDILYSTLCNIHQKVFSGVVRWISHVLVSDSGLTYKIKQKRKYVNNFLPWDEIKKIRRKGGGMLVISPLNAILKLNQIKMKPKFDKRFETKIDFRKRINSFGNLVMNLFSKKGAKTITRFLNRPTSQQ